MQGMQQGTSPAQARRGTPRAFLTGRGRIALTLAGVCLALVGLYALAGFILLPYLIERYTPTWVNSRLGVELRVGEVSFNPFSLYLAAGDLQLAAGDAAPPLLTVGAAAVDMAWSTLWRTGWRFSSLMLSGAHAQLQIGADGEFNWAALLPRKPADDSQQSPQWRFEQVRLESGRITLVDRRGEAPATAQLGDIEASLSDFGNIERGGSQPARYAFSATLDSGGTLHGEGSLALQPQVQSAGSLRLADIALTEPWPLLSRVLGLAIGPLAEQLSASAQYRVAITSGAPELQIDQGEFRLRNLVVQPASGEPALLRLDTLVGSGGRLRLGERELSLSALQLLHGALSLGIDAQGELDLQLLTASAATRPPDEPWSSDVAAAPWRLRIEALQVDDVALHLDDRSRQLALHAAALGAKASLSVAFGGGPLQLELDAVEARLDLPRLTSRTGAQSGGANDVPLLAFDSLAASGVALHTGQRRIEAASISALGGHAALEFGAEERVGLLQALRQPPQAGEAEASPAAASSASADKPWRYTVHSIQLEGLGLDIRHSGYDPPVAARLGDIEATLSDFSNLQREGGQSARYAFSAALDSGGTLHGEGTLALQPQVQSAGSLRLADIALAGPWPLLSRVLGLAIGPLAEQLSASAQYRVAITSGAPELQIDQGEFRLRNLVVQPASGEPALLRLDTLAGSGGRLLLGTREVSLATLQLQRGRLSLGIDAQGEVDLELLAASSAVRPPDDPGLSKNVQTSAPWRLRIEALHIDDVALHLSDRSRQLALDAAALGAKASFSVAFGAGPLRLELDAVEARLDQPRLTSIGGAESDGANAAPLLAFDSLAASGGSLHTGQRRIEATSISARGGHATLEFGSEEPVSLLQALRPQPTTRSKAVTTASVSAEKPWRYAIGSIGVEALGLDMRHGGYDPPIVYAGELRRATLQRVDNTAQAPIQVEAQINLADGGTAQFSGTMAQSAAIGQGELRIDALPLLPLQPLLARLAQVQLREGQLSAALQLSLRRDPDADLHLQATGQAGVQALRIDEMSSGDRLLSWRSLHAAGLELSTAPRRLKIAEVTVQRPGAKLVIAEDRQVNLTQLLHEEAPGVGTGDVADAGDPAARAAQQAPSFEVTIERLRFEVGVLDFADLSLVLPFSTKVTELSGGVVNISTRGDERARVEAVGRIGSYGSARFSGSLLPFAPKQFLNIQAVMENVEIPPFSPYTATFAGRKVEKGRLWLDLDYRIEERRLLGKNGIRLSDFKLGERVEAPHAIDAQLDMVVALLKDDNGNIQLSIPVSGDLGKPRVAVGALLGEAVGKVLQRIVTAPFRALARAFGGAGDGEDLARIEFAPGNDALAPPQREKLQTVGRALAQRPQLGLVVDGPYAPAVDAQALRRRAAREELARAVGNTVGTSAGPIAFESKRIQAALETMLVRYTGSDARAASAPTGAVPAAGPYPAMFDRIVQNFPLADSAFQLLAARRADAIREYLVEEAGAPVERVRTGKLLAVDATERQAIASTLELLPHATGTAAPVSNTARSGGTR